MELPIYIILIPLMQEKPVRRPVRQCNPDGRQPNGNDNTLGAMIVYHFIQLCITGFY